MASWIIPILKAVAQTVVAMVVSSLTESGRLTHRARVNRHRNNPHGWRPPDEDNTGNQNSQKEPTLAQQLEDVQTKISEMQGP